MKILNFFTYGVLAITGNLMFCQSLGQIKPNTNLALPSSYNMQEYVFDEPNDQGVCLGFLNESATIEEVFFSQTHRHSINHPFFFTIGYRPFLIQVAVTGSGNPPDVKVSGFLNGSDLGTLCLKGPDVLNPSIDLNEANFKDYFNVTIPKAWVQDGLELILTVGDTTRTFTRDQLKIGPYTELNLVMVNMDILDYNLDPPKNEIYDGFLGELASAIPTSVVRFGVFPETLYFPEIVATDGAEKLIVLNNKAEIVENGLSEGSINSIAKNFLSNLHKSTGDFLSTVYYGNTLNLRPGGWGGGKSFVSFDYNNIFIHELGHALSLPHWSQASNPDAGEGSYLYPYEGETGNKGGRGRTWNFIQDSYEFASPICQTDKRDNLGKERSDCMQRANACREYRSSKEGPWDGFSDFSALAMHRYMIGAETAVKGKVLDNSELKDFQFKKAGGFPVMSLDTDGKRIYKRDRLQNQNLTGDEKFDLPGSEKIEQDVYLIYGNIHEIQNHVNTIYKPIKFKGTLPPIIDPTDPITFSKLIDVGYIPDRDILIKVYYKDGSVLHAINPYHTYRRQPYPGGLGIWRSDICNYSLVVPADKELTKVELYKRPFNVRSGSNPSAGNLNHQPHNIKPDNFMEDAVYLGNYDMSTFVFTPAILDENGIVNVYPNPFTEYLVIATNEFLEYSFSLINSLGQEILTLKLRENESEIDLKYLSPGFYSLMARNKKGKIVLSRKLMKI